MRQTLKLDMTSDLRDGGVSQDVVGGGGLLDPQRFERGQTGDPADGLLHVPALVSIQHLVEQRYGHQLAQQRYGHPLAQQLAEQRYGHPLA